MAYPAAPAPLTTIFRSSNCFPVTRHALMRAASTTTAVPCWSSCITGIPIPCNASSSSKHFGAAMSSSAIPPKTGAMFLHFINKFRVITLKTDGECIDIRELLEQEGFSLHNGDCCISPDIPE